MTYNKKLIEITITTVDGNTVTITDTAEDQKASLALAEIKRGGNVLIEGDSSNTLVLASAIVQVEITQLEDAEVERANPYGCEGGGTDGGEVYINALSGEFGIAFNWEGEKVMENDATTNKTHADFLDLLNNHDHYEVVLATSCGTFVLEYSEDQYEKKLSVYDDGVPHIESAITYDVDSNGINIYGEITDACLPIQVKVYEK